MKRIVMTLALALAACAPEEEPMPEIVEPKTKPSLETFGVSETTKDMFKREGMARLQQKLNNKLSTVKEELAEGAADAGGNTLKNKPPEEKLVITAMLDEKTQRALGAFQKAENLPETGMPDYETLDRLGMKPSDLFHHRPPANRNKRDEQRGEKLEEEKKVEEKQQKQ
ncbi:MAG: peptidoglycan-binding domain-containing protein [Archangium sp.]